ncbi:tyrosine-type recombinase/integrase [Burkholderia gladioli]|uniref:tyrosine-type recombinase/integrase n=1 Tax=Burkholderia gladioli TaxID=28095 RepID=UPI00163E79F3|nr:site-specific integrase [Burkholderia gladioli]
MRTLHRLSAIQIARTKKPGLYSDGGGLYLQVTKGLVKSWLFRYMRMGVRRGMGLGPLHTITLADARDRAYACRRLLHIEGIDPLEARRTKQQAALRARLPSLRFRECADQYMEVHGKSWKNEKHVAQWKSTIETYANPVIGDLMVLGIDTHQIMKVLLPIWVNKTETATRLRGRIESILAWATVWGYRTGPNPARWKGHLDHLLPKPSRVRKEKHHAALPYIEALAFMKKLQRQEGAAAQALQLLILTASRTNEVIGARKSEFDLQTNIWIVPAERMKAGLAHRVPLSAWASQLVKALISVGTGEFLFPARNENRHLSNMAMLQLLKRMKRQDLTVHGFRSTFKDWARETTDHAREVSEAALAHVIRDRTEAAYARGDMFIRRSVLMQDWANYLLKAAV